MSSDQKISPCLWFVDQAEEAANFYVSVFPDSRIDNVWRTPVDTPGPNAGSVVMVEFTLAGQKYQALNGGKHDTFNDAISLSVSCADQAEVDRYWEALTADGGRPVQCGWLKDKYGLSWQIVPAEIGKVMQGSDPAGTKRAWEAMMQMVKLDIDRLKAAYEGKA